MRCMICTHPEVKEINALLLQRSGRRVGVVTALARKMKISRQCIWRHRKEHLRMNTSRRVPKLEGMSFEARAALLAVEADRIQMQAENGAAPGVVNQAMKALGMRMKLLQLEAQLAGRLSGGKGGHAVNAKNLEEALRSAEAAARAEEDPAELAKAEREFQEVCGPEVQP